MSILIWDLFLNFVFAVKMFGRNAVVIAGGKIKYINLDDLFSC